MSQRRQRNFDRENEGKGLSPARVAAGAGLALGATFAVASPAQAATFEVANLQPDGPNSIRDAINQANAAVGADTITFQAGLTGTINLNNDPTYGDTGALYVADHLEILGPGRDVLAISANADSRVFYAGGNDPIDFRIDGIQVRQGNPKYDDGPPFGGNIMAPNTNLTITNSEVRTGVAAIGGGIWNFGNLTIRNSTISGNEAQIGGGGVVFRDYAEQGQAVISGSTINNNGASNQFFFPFYSRDSADQKYGGGGIAADGPLTISRSTIANNSTAGNGGGLLFERDDAQNLTVQSSTVSGNAAGAGGGIYSYTYDPPDVSSARRAPGDPNLESTIVAGNEADAANFGHDLGGGPFNAAFSLIQRPAGVTIDATVAGSNLFNVDPLLGALADNGGTTRTMRLNSGSPALDAGRTPAGEDSDQRGVERPIDLRAADNAAGGDGADIGAYERRGQPIVVPPEPTGSCKGVDATISGTNGRDFLRGTPGRDVIVAKGGPDAIRGRGGNDLICAGSGIDVATGGGGRDRLFGQPGNDRLFGQEGRDYGEGGKGADLLAGGEQADELHGGAQKDRVLGAEANDRLFGEGGDDVVLGALGNDFIRGGPGTDRVSGGRGINDVQQ